MRGSPAGPGTEAALGKSLDSTQIYKGFREGVDTPLSRAAALLLDTRTPRTQAVHVLLCSGGIFDQQPCLIATSAISKSLQTIEAFTFSFTSRPHCTPLQTVPLASRETDFLRACLTRSRERLQAFLSTDSEPTGIRPTGPELRLQKSSVLRPYFSSVDSSASSSSFITSSALSFSRSARKASKFLPLYEK